MGNKRSKEMKHNDTAKDIRPTEQCANSRSVQLAMDCYWTGEGTLGPLPGVISTQAGSCTGYFETVQVIYDPALTNPEKLRATSGFRLVKGNPKFRPARKTQQKYYLQNTKGLSHVLILNRGGLVEGSTTVATQMNALVGGYGTPEILKDVIKKARLVDSEAKLLSRLYKARRKH